MKVSDIINEEQLNEKGLKSFASHFAKGAGLISDEDFADLMSPSQKEAASKLAQAFIQTWQGKVDDAAMAVRTRGVNVKGKEGVVRFRKYLENEMKKVVRNTLRIDYDKNPNYGDFISRISHISAIKPDDLAKNPDFIKNVQGMISTAIKDKETVKPSKGRARFVPAMHLRDPEGDKVFYIKGMRDGIWQGYKPSGDGRELARIQMTQADMKKIQSIYDRKEDLLQQYKISVINPDTIELTDDL